jgi:LDH2 family malate/lactate/ureidoglycolate dehydrogenase
VRAVGTKEEPPEVAAIVTEEALTQFVVEVLRRFDVPARDARTVADVLVLADLRGVGSHGVARLSRYVDGLKDGSIQPRDKSKVVKETEVTALVDGGNSLGQVVGRRAMELAMAKASKAHLGFVAVRNSNHYGIAGYYALMALRKNMVGISYSNSFPLVVPTFGRKAVIGTNPMSFAAPGLEEPFVLDMATSVVPRGKLEEYDRLGKPLPLGWAVDAAGRGTTNPREVLDNMANRRGGGILPLGGEGEIFSGHKGYGLSVMLDILCGVLPGAAFGPDVYGDPRGANVGHFFGAIDVKAFRPLADFRRDMGRMIRTLQESPKAEGQDRIYIHGEKSRAFTVKRRREGIPLGPKVAASMRKIGEEAGVPWIA